MNKFCAKCGQRAQSDAVLCSYCGNKFGGASMPQQAPGHPVSGQNFSEQSTYSSQMQRPAQQTQNTVFCRRCGTKNDPSGIYCPRCKLPIESQPQPQSRANQYSSPTPTPNRYSEQSQPAANRYAQRTPAPNQYSARSQPAANQYTQRTPVANQYSAQSQYGANRHSGYVHNVNQHSGYAHNANQHSGYAHNANQNLAYAPGPSRPRRKSSNKKVIIICTVVVLAIVAAGYFVFFAGGSGGRTAESALNNYIQAAFAADVGTMRRYMAMDIDAAEREVISTSGMNQMEFRNYLRTFFGVDSLDGVIQMQLRDSLNMLESSLGGPIRVDIDILDRRIVSRGEMQNRIENMENEFRWSGMNLNNVINVRGINEMVDFEINLSIIGRHDRWNQFDRFTMVRIGQSWYAFDSDFVLQSFAFGGGFGW